MLYDTNADDQELLGRRSSECSSFSLEKSWIRGQTLEESTPGSCSIILLLLLLLLLLPILMPMLALLPVLLLFRCSVLIRGEGTCEDQKYKNAAGILTYVVGRRVTIFLRYSQRPVESMLRSLRMTAFMRPLFGPRSHDFKSIGK